MTLPLYVRDVIDDSLCVTYDMTSSGVQSDGAKVTVLFTFVSSFSPTAGLQTLQRHMYSAGGLVVESGSACWRRLSNFTSSLLNLISVVTFGGKD